MPARCMVEHKDSDGEVTRRVVTFESNENRVSKCLKVFAVDDSFELECLDPEFNEYVRITDAEKLEGGAS